MSSFGDLFGFDEGFLDSLLGKKSDTPPGRPKVQLRRKIVDGTTYIHADDVAALLDAANVQPALAKKLRDLN